MSKDITAIIVTSVLPSHPDTSIVEETIASVRHHLPQAEIILQIDGLRHEQIDRKKDYDEYKNRILWKCLHTYTNVLPVVFDEHMHQSDMLKATIDLVRTPLLLYGEGDAPLVVDEKIDWEKCIDFIYSGEANTVRFHHEGVIPKEHEGLMLGTKDKFMRTYQWSQRPHLSSVLYYKDTVIPTLKPKFFIEDTYHGVVDNDWKQYGRVGWNKHRLWIYYPNDRNIKRSYHTDGRQGGRKFTSDDDTWGYK